MEYTVSDFMLTEVVLQNYVKYYVTVFDHNLLDMCLKVLKEIALKDCRSTRITRSAPMFSAAVPRRQTSSATNCRTVRTTAPLQKHSIDDASCFGVSHTEHSINPQESVYAIHGASIDCIINRPYVDQCIVCIN